MKSRTSTFGVTAITAITTLSLAAPAAALDRCKIKVDRKTGVIAIDATGVVGTLLWGGEEGEETNMVFDSGCVDGDKAKKCVLADPSTLEAKTPPESCTIYLLDDDFETCSGWVSGCTPGPRSLSDVTNQLNQNSFAVIQLQDKTQCMSATPTRTTFDGCEFQVLNAPGAGVRIDSDGDLTLRTTQVGSDVLIESDGELTLRNTLIGADVLIESDGDLTLRNRTNGSDVLIESDGDLTLRNTTGGDVLIKSRGDLTLEADRTMSSSARTMNLSSTLNVSVQSSGGIAKLQGATAELNGSATAKVVGGGLTEINGATITLNNGGLPVAHVGSTVSGGGVVTTGSASVLVP